MPVKGGRFGNKLMPRDMAPGDLVLCYCTGTYKGFERSVPGIGIVSKVNWPARDYRYDYLAFQTPVPLEVLRHLFTESDRFKLGNIRWDTFQFFELSEESFRAVMRGVKLTNAKRRRLLD
ncbi:MAG: hypothetical protein FJ318_02585 [SAR202 cluster bacterium]|nr:hypothetical protein [SAR202 cluster bacterium]